MFRKALESILRVSLHISSCVCYQPIRPPDTVYLLWSPLVFSFPLGLTHLTATHTHTHTRGTKRNLLSYKQTYTQSGSWESAMREQVSVFTWSSHGGSECKYINSFSKLLELDLLTASGHLSTLAADMEPLHLHREVGIRQQRCSHTGSSQHKTTMEQRSYSDSVRCTHHTTERPIRSKTLTCIYILCSCPVFSSTTNLS